MIHIVCDKNYKLDKRCAKSIEKFYKVTKHEIPEYDLDLPFGEQKGEIIYNPKSQWKPYFIAEQLKKDDVFYLDADTYMNEKVDEMMEADVSITTHQPPKLKEGLFPHITAYVNAGVVWVKNNPNGHQFMNDWKEAMKETISGSDQEALTILYKRGLPSYVKTFPTSIYNNTRPEKGKAKIDHYVGWRKKLYPK